MKKIFRIIRVWYKGKLKYAKRYKRWMKGQLIRDLIAYNDTAKKDFIRKYGNQDFMDWYIKNTTKTPSSKKLNK